MEYDPIKMDGRDTVFHRNLEKKEGKKKKKKKSGRRKLTREEISFVS